MSNREHEPSYMEDDIFLGENWRQTRKRACFQNIPPSSALISGPR